MWTFQISIRTFLSSKASTSCLAHTWLKNRTTRSENSWCASLTVSWISKWFRTLIGKRYMLVGTSSHRHTTRHSTTTSQNSRTRSTPHRSTSSRPRKLSTQILKGQYTKPRNCCRATACSSLHTTSTSSKPIICRQNSGDKTYFGTLTNGNIGYLSIKLRPLRPQLSLYNSRPTLNFCKDLWRLLS